MSEPDGELVPGQDAVQMRLAMNSLLDRAGVVHEGLMGDEDRTKSGVDSAVCKNGKLREGLGSRFTRVGRGRMRRGIEFLGEVVYTN